MKNLKQKTMEWLEKRFGKALYNDLCSKKTIEEEADYFLENNSIDEITVQGGLNNALEAWTEGFTSAKEMDSMYTEKQIEMMQENACAANEGRPFVYTEEEIDEAE